MSDTITNSIIMFVTVENSSEIPPDVFVVVHFFTPLQVLAARPTLVWLQSKVE
eukprot:jgi/Botrbrau1/22243/Bobra.0138s0005.1